MLLGWQGNETRLLARTEERAAQLDTDRENKQYLEGMMFPDSMSVHHEPRRALSNTDCVIIAVPSVAMREVIEAHVAEIAPDSIVVSATKGLEIESGKRMSEIIAECISARHSLSVEEAMTNICALSGPNLSVEIAIGLPALATAASVSIETAERVQMMTSGERFRVYASDDIIGVELGGTLKNIIAIGAGFIDASGLGSNLKAAYVTRGLHEITLLGLALGAKPTTFAGLSGVGRHAYDLLQSFESELPIGYEIGRRRFCRRRVRVRGSDCGGGADDSSDVADRAAAWCRDADNGDGAQGDVRGGTADGGDGGIDATGVATGVTEVQTFVSSKPSGHRDRSGIISFTEVSARWSQSLKITKKSLGKMLSS